MKYEAIRNLQTCKTTIEDLEGQINKVGEELKEFSHEHYENLRYVRMKSIGGFDPNFTHKIRREHETVREALVMEGLDVIASVLTYFDKAGISLTEVEKGVLLVNTKNRKRGYTN